MGLFKRTPTPEPKPLVDVKTNYPSGLFVDTGDAVYYIKGGTKFKCFTYRVFLSWNAEPVFGTLESLGGFINGGSLGFRDGTLIHNISDGRMYLVSANKRRHITSPDVFDRYGLNRERVIEVSDAETRLHAEGEPLE